MEDMRMSQKERRRLELLSRVRDKELTLVPVAELCPLSYRQCKRLWHAIACHARNHYLNNLSYVSTSCSMINAAGWPRRTSSAIARIEPST